MSYKQPSALPVVEGGTLASSFTAYCVICAGTSSTAFLQNVVGTGSAGQVLTCNGTSALPSWQAAPTGNTTVVFIPLSVDYTPADNGRVWYNTTTIAFKGYKNSSIVTFSVT